jgi:hypothetical protein
VILLPPELPDVWGRANVGFGSPGRNGPTPWTYRFAPFARRLVPSLAWFLHFCIRFRSETSARRCWIRHRRRRVPCRCSSSRSGLTVRVLAGKWSFVGLRRSVRVLGAMWDRSGGSASMWPGSVCGYWSSWRVRSRNPWRLGGRGEWRRLAPIREDGPCGAGRDLVCNRRWDLGEGVRRVTTPDRTRPTPFGVSYRPQFFQRLAFSFGIFRGSWWMLSF